MTKPSLVSNKFVRSSDKGHVEIPEDQLTHADKPREVADELSRQYAKLVEDNPDYIFQILHDPMQRKVTVVWEKRQ